MRDWQCASHGRRASGRDRPRRTTARSRSRMRPARAASDAAPFRAASGGAQHGRGRSGANRANQSVASDRDDARSTDRTLRASRTLRSATTPSRKLSRGRHHEGHRSPWAQSVCVESDRMALSGSSSVLRVAARIQRQVSSLSACSRESSDARWRWLRCRAAGCDLERAAKAAQPKSRVYGGHDG